MASELREAARRAAKGLRALGPEAEAAFFLLIDQVKQGEGQAGLPWVGITALIHRVPDSISIITNELSDPIYHSQTAYFLARYATNVEVSLLVLSSGLDGPFLE